MTSALMRLSLSLSVGTAMLARRPRLKLSTTLMPIPPPPPLPPTVATPTPAAWLAVPAAAGGQLALYRLTLVTVKIPIRKLIRSFLPSHRQVTYYSELSVHTNRKYSHDTS